MKIKKKLTVVYFNDEVIALCDKDNIKSCDFDDDCSKCNHNKLKALISSIGINCRKYMPSRSGVCLTCGRRH